MPKLYAKLEDHIQKALDCLNYQEEPNIAAATREFRAMLLVDCLKMLNKLLIVGFLLAHPRTSYRSISRLFRLNGNISSTFNDYRNC